MKHASEHALDQLEDVLAELRSLSGLKEKKRGVFYKGSQAFAHFHEDAEGLFADLKLKAGWRRFCISRASEREEFLLAARNACG